MKEDNIDFLLAGVILAVIIAAVIVCCVGCHETEETTRAKIKAGLVEKPMTYQHWARP